MKVSQIIAILLLCVAFVAATKHLKARNEWELFKSKYGRIYATAEEESNRFAIFKKNLRDARERTAKSKYATFGVTKFSDLTVEEFKSLYLMNVSQPALPLAPLPTQPKLNAVRLPSSFDWSSKGALTPVKNQGQCGSCWDFSATETIESVCFLAGYPLTQLSEQQILDCDTTDGGCNGGWPYTAYNYVISAGGIETEADYPYTAQDGTCQFNANDVACKVSSWKYVTQNQDENVMQNFLYNNSPLSVCVDASSWSSYTGGVITPSECTTNIDHCVQATGFSVQSGINAWNIRNSWGTDWGENGYIYLQIGGDTCAVAQVVTVPCVQSKDGKTVC